MFELQQRTKRAPASDDVQQKDAKKSSKQQSETYTVKKGDTLGKIAARLLGDASRYTEIQALNNLPDPNRIDVGQLLSIPSKSGDNGGGADVAPRAPVPTPGGAETYTVRRGDTLAKIAVRLLGDASRFREIARLNGIANPNLIAVGQVLKVPGSTGSQPAPAPSGKGTTYTVLPGDTLSKIAVDLLRDGSRWRDIAALNGITNPGALRIGQVLRIPDTDTTVEVPPAPGGGPDSGWRWPTDSHRITSNYGMRTHPITGQKRMHHGLDIGAGAGSNIYAARSGTVAYSGWAGGYGNVVYIDHAGGIQTRYAHCSTLNVKSGAKVTQGQVVAKVGSTGNSTGPHLHFEVRVGGSTVNPRDYVS